MASYNQENDIVGGGMGGLGFGGGYGIIILLFLFFAIFSGGLFGRHDRHDDGDFRRCGTCVEDESNWQEDRHLSDKACENTEKIIANQNHIAERQEDRYVRNLEMSNMQKDNYIQTLQLEKNFDGKFGGLLGAVKDGFCKTDRDIDKLACELPKRPMVFARCDTTCLQKIPDNGCHDRGRRNDCDDWN